MNKIKDIIGNISSVPLSTWLRFALLAAGILNLALRCLGIDALRFTNEEIGSAVSIIFAAVSALAAYWKNNSFTSAALEADRILAQLRADDGRR